MAGQAQDDGTNILKEVAGIGILHAYGSSVPTGQVGYAKGCLFTQTSDGVIYRNSGSKTSATWTALADA